MKSPWNGWSFAGLAVALLAVAGLVQEARLIYRGSSPGALTVFVVAIRTLLLAAGALALFRRSRYRSGRDQVLAALRGVLAQHGSEVPSTTPASAEQYAKTPPADLLDIYRHLDRAAHPERFAALLWSIRAVLTDPDDVARHF